MGYGIFIPPAASERELRFSVELAQLAGFCSMGLPARPVIRSLDMAEPGVKYLCASGSIADGAVIPAPPGDDPAGAWLRAYELCRMRPERACPAACAQDGTSRVSSHPSR